MSQKILNNTWRCTCIYCNQLISVGLLLGSANSISPPPSRTPARGAVVLKQMTRRCIWRPAWRLAPRKALLLMTEHQVRRSFTRSFRFFMYRFMINDQARGWKVRGSSPGRGNTFLSSPDYPNHLGGQSGSQWVTGFFTGGNEAGM